jgi:hypothetical protein
MARKTRCTKCGKDAQNVTMVLMMGPQGYRRYPICDPCKAEAEKKQAAKMPTHTTEQGASRHG